MKKIISLAICLFILISSINLVSSVPINNNTTDQVSINNKLFNEIEDQQIIQNINNLDGYFTENRGQVDNDSVRFYIQGKGVWFLDNAVVFKIQEHIDRPEFQYDPYDDHFAEDEPEEPLSRKVVVLKLNFEGCNNVEPKGYGLLPYRSNFFYGNDSNKWCANVPNFQEIIFENIYENIDLRYYSSDKGLKYDFIVQPGGDPATIKLNWEGMEDLRLDNKGNLILQTSIGNIIDSELFIYQNENDIKNEIEGSMKVINHNTYGFEIDKKYDNTKSLIIDPLIYSTYIGGARFDRCYSHCIDSAGNAYVTGHTDSANFPTTPGAYDIDYNSPGETYDDIFVFKLNPTGTSLLFSTYLGGITGDFGKAVMLDQTGNIIVMGGTSSTDFPVTSSAYSSSHNGGSWDLIISKFDPTGSSLLYSTYLGGSDTEDAAPNGIRIDSSGNVYLIGQTHSSDFPVTSGAYDEFHNGDRDAIALKFNPSLTTLIYSTFIGGSDRDSGYGIGIDESGNLYATGGTKSSNFPVTSGAHDNTLNGITDGILFKLNPQGSSLEYSTYIGGDGYDLGNSIAVKSNGCVYITGYTNSNNFPITPGAFDTMLNGDYDGYVLEMNSDGKSILHSTYIGGTEYEHGKAIQIDSSNNIYLSGETKSPDFPTLDGVYDTSFNNLTDIFVIKMDSICSKLLYSTFIGGDNLDSPGYSIPLDSDDNIYVAGRTYSDDFPTSPNAFDNTRDDWDDLVVFKLNLTYYPSVLDLNVSDNNILRTNSIYLSSNFTDIEDIEENLTPSFEYQAPDEQDWRSDYFQNLQFKNSCWSVAFTPPITAKLGLYNFRVMCNDTANLFSDWMYLNGSLTVINNLPTIENLFFSNEEALWGETILVYINGFDVEDTEQNLSIELEYQDPSHNSWNKTYLHDPDYIIDKWEYSFTLPYDSPFGYYDFRARFNDTDGNTSNWLYANDPVLVYNQAPMVIDVDFSKDSVYRTRSLFLYVNSTDHENSESKLEFFIELKDHNNDSWSPLNGYYSNSNNRWETEVVTNINSILGFYDLRLKFDDQNGATSGWYYLNNSIEILNNLPIIEDITLSDTSVYRTNSVNIIINAFDKENSEIELDPRVQYKPQSGSWMDCEGNQIFGYGQWKVIFTPSSTAELGSYDIRVNFIDLDNDESGWKTISNAIEIMNNLPEISKACDNFEVDNSTIMIPLLDYASDVEDPSEELSWSVDQSSVNTSLISVQIVDLTKTYLQITPIPNMVNDDDISLILIDKDGGTSSKLDVTLNINSMPEAIYKIDISVLPVKIEIDEDGNVTLTIKNNGNTENNYVIDFESDQFDEQDILIEPRSITLEPGMETKIQVRIKAPEDVGAGEYYINFFASNEMYSKNTTLAVKIIESSEEGQPDKISGNFMTIIIILIILTLCIFFILIFRRKINQKQDQKLLDGRSSLTDLPKMDPSPSAQTGKLDSTLKTGKLKPRSVTASISALPKAQQLHDPKQDGKLGTEKKLLTNQLLTGKIDKETYKKKRTELESNTITQALPAKPVLALPAKPKVETNHDNELKLLRERLIKGEINQTTYMKLRTELETD